MRVFEYENIIGGFILLHFNCASEVPAVDTVYTSIMILSVYMQKTFNTINIISQFAEKNNVA